MIVGLAGVSDLITSDGKYHSSCFVQFTRKKTSKAKDQIERTDLAMQWLVQEQKEAAEKSHVLELSEVRKRYTKLADAASVQIPASFISRRASFKEKLVLQVEDVYDSMTVREKRVSE